MGILWLGVLGLILPIWVLALIAKMLGVIDTRWNQLMIPLYLIIGTIILLISAVGVIFGALSILGII